MAKGTARIAIGLFAIIALALAGGWMAGRSDPVREIADVQSYLPPMGSNAIFNAATAAAPGHELILADLRLPPDAVGEPHSHPWEEYLYVIGGSALLDIEGMEPRTLQAGETFVIPRQTVHTPTAGPDGIRAIVARVHAQGEPLSVPAPQ